MATLENLLAETGRFSWFQVMILIFTMSPKMLMSWSMLTMSFAGVTPDWWCVYDVDDTRDNTTFQICNQNQTEPCTRVYSYAIRTVVNEWDLVCGKSWIIPAVTSIQMGGVLVGAFAGGQSADVIGRRYTLYASMLVHGVANIVAAYSVSWQMFAVLRFVLGFMIGSTLVVQYTYAMEFIGVSKRSVVSSIPTWSLGVALFALTTWRLENWSQIHLVCAAMHVIYLVGFFFVPESPRWLAVHNRLDEAERVINKMCSMNGVARPPNCRAKLAALAEEERRQRESGRKYTYIEIVRGWSMFRRTVLIDVVWCSMSLIYFGLSFGVDKLSGNLYLNIFLMSAIEIPGMLCIMYVTNCLGRRRASAGLLTIGLLGALGVIIAFYAFNLNKGVVITVLALVSRCGVGVAMNAFKVLSSESYPTVIRNLGYGAANTAGRVGGIISPYLFTSFKDVGIPFILVAVMFVVSITCCLLLDETNNTPLQDTIDQRDQDQTEKAGHSPAFNTQHSSGQEAVGQPCEEAKGVDSKSESQTAIDSDQSSPDKPTSDWGNTGQNASDVFEMKETKAEDCVSKTSTTVDENKTEDDGGQISGQPGNVCRQNNPEMNEGSPVDSAHTDVNNSPLSQSSPVQTDVSTLSTDRVTDPPTSGSPAVVDSGQYCSRL